MANPNAPFFTTKNKFYKCTIIEEYNDGLYTIKSEKYNARNKLIETFQYVYDDYNVLSIIINTKNMKNKLLHYKKEDRKRSDVLSLKSKMEFFDRHH